MMRTWRGLALCAIVMAGNSLARSAELTDDLKSNIILLSPLAPNDNSMAASSISEPDTFLGVRNVFGSVYFTDDDGSPLGNGYASGLEGVPTNSGGISFLITGYNDEFFVGSHSEAGGYRVFVDVFDFFGDLIDSFSDARVLAPGEVHDFSYSDFEWVGGSYDVYIDNTVGVVPEPPAFGLVAIAALGATFAGRRR